MIIHTKRRPFVCRFWTSYCGWRACMNPLRAARAAWEIARLL